MASVTIPTKGYDTKIAESNSSGFVKWLKYAHDWKQIQKPIFTEMLKLFNEAHTKVLSSSKQNRPLMFYSELSTLTALGVASALAEIKLLLVKTISEFFYQRRIQFIIFCSPGE